MFRSESEFKLAVVSSTSSNSKCHSGFHAPTALVSIQLAKPSFSQMSSHHRMVTKSPNHWCAISCAITTATRLRSSTDACWSSSWSSACRYVMKPVFSIAPAEKSGKPIMSSFSKGYRMPKYWLKYFMHHSETSSA